MILGVGALTRTFPLLNLDFAEPLVYKWSNITFSILNKRTAHFHCQQIRNGIFLAQSI